MGLNTVKQSQARKPKQAHTKNTTKHNHKKPAATRQNQKRQTSRCPPRLVLEVVAEIQVESAQSMRESRKMRIFFFGLAPLYYISSTVGRSCWARHNG